MGHGLDAATALIDRVAPTVDDVNPEREALLAALNGLWGDHLEASGNPLAIPMRLRVAGRPLDLAGPAALARQLPGIGAHSQGAETPSTDVDTRPQGAEATPPRAGSRLLVLVHGLCMNDLQWLRHGHDHGAHLAEALGYTPVYLRYNTGQHTSTNGAELSALLTSLVASWPVPVTELSILAHSMGGLVARSACHQLGCRSTGAQPHGHSAAHRKCHIQLLFWMQREPHEGHATGHGCLYAALSAHDGRDLHPGHDQVAGQNSRDTDFAARKVVQRVDCGGPARAARRRASP